MYSITGCSPWSSTFGLCIPVSTIEVDAQSVTKHDVLNMFWQGVRICAGARAVSEVETVCAGGKTDLVRWVLANCLEGGRDVVGLIAWVVHDHVNVDHVLRGQFFHDRRADTFDGQLPRAEC